MLTLIRREADLLAAAFRYFTRLPVPSRHDAVHLNDSLRYLPVVGWIVGGCGALVLLAASYVLPASLAVLLGMAATLLITGAFHEDGFADYLDGMGGQSREDVLRIMKDPGTGVFGTIGLIMILAIKFFALLSFPAAIVAYILIAAHSLSRWMAASVTIFLPYARKTEVNPAGKPTGKALPFAGKRSLVPSLLSLLLAAVPLFFLDLRLAPIAFIPAAALTWGMARTFRVRIGGYTGDCLGAVQQCTEVAIYLAALIAQPWIST